MSALGKARALAVMQPRFLMSELLGIGDRVHAEPAMTLASRERLRLGRASLGRSDEQQRNLSRRLGGRIGEVLSL